MSVMSRMPLRGILDIGLHSSRRFHLHVEVRLNDERVYLMQYHVSPKGSDAALGSQNNPFRTISFAAQVANPGDTVIVHDGVYREWVDPQRGGTCEADRIIYRAADGERPVIKGSEIIRGWEPCEGDVWRVALDDAMFGEFNPYKEPLFGDWLAMPSHGEDPDKHPGMVFLNGEALYEVTSLDDVFNPQYRDHVKDYVTGIACPIDNPAMTQCVWYVHAEGDRTVLYANFHGSDPNSECVEIAVRRSCFFPKRHHVNYITVAGFELCQAATQWAPPTAHQFGIVGPNWATGWIIEHNLIHDAKCSGISLGTSEETGDNEWYRTERKTGHQYQLEAVFKGLRAGWRKGFVGSHIVRDNVIHDCGQNAIVGHMGGAFSTIEHNHIYRIGTRREFFGWEVAGIKLHAALDAKILNNCVHDCSLGMWLDWQAQGVRISRNVFFDNIRDLEIEVTHGPCLIDNNAFCSAMTFDNYAQGTAFVNNLIGGTISNNSVLDRFTPYHYPHSTDVAGIAFVYGGDDRYVSNIFLDGAGTFGSAGLSAYRGYPSTMKEYLQNVHDIFASGITNGHDPQPVQMLYSWDNAYVGSAEGPEEEPGSMHVAPSVSIHCEFEGDNVYLLFDCPQELVDKRTTVTSTADLGVPRIVDERYEETDGSDIVIDVDILGRRREKLSSVGPFAELCPGANRQLAWRGANQTADNIRYCTSREW